ncbi:MAG TPA: hypothetical protein PKL83_02300 [bacterium]|nr:hypothetical protein [bacterium]
MLKKYFLLFGITVSLLIAAPAYAWDDCPFGLENDPYPGDCARYIDTDGNGICDLSEPAPEERVIVASPQVVDDSVPVMSDGEIADPVDAVQDEYAFHISGSALKALTIAELAEYWGDIPVECLLNHLKLESGASSLNSDTTIAFLHDTYGMTPTAIKDIAQAVYDEKHVDGAEIETDIGIDRTQAEISTSSANATTASTAAVTVKASITDSYHFIALSLLAAVLFLIGKLFVLAGKVTLASERKFWNSVLAVSFIISAVTGLLLSMQRDLLWFPRLPRQLLWLHAEASIFMAYIGMYHFFWHWRYYVRLLRRKKISHSE